MGNLTKVYTVTIEGQGAVKTLNGLKQELQQLSEHLGNLAPESQEAIAALEEMAKLQKQIQAASTPIELVDKSAPGTLAALKEQAEQLEQELEQLTMGTSEWKQKMLELGRTKGAIKEVEDAVDALDPKMQSAAFLDFTNGIVGGFGVATVAAENFGLASQGSAEAVEKQMLQLMAVMQSMEAIHKAMNSETRASMRNMLDLVKTNVKSVLGLGDGWTLAAIKARFFGTTARAALTSTGIGVLVVALGLVISNFDSIVGWVGKMYNKFSTAFPGVGKFIDTVTAKLRDFASVVSFGLIDDSVTAAVKKVEEAEKKATEGRIDRRKRLIAEEEAAGRSTYKLKQQQLADELKLLDKGTKEYADKQSEIRALKNQHDRELQKAADAAAKEAEDKRKAAAEKYKQQAEKEAEERKKAEEKASEQAAALRNRRYQMAKAAGEKEQVLLQIEIENLTEQQAELYKKEKDYTDKWYELQNQKLEKQKEIARITKEESEKEATRQKELRDKELEKLQERADIDVAVLKLRKATEKELTEATIKGLERQLVYLEKIGQVGTKAYYDIKLEIQELKDSLKPTGVFASFLQKVFGDDYEFAMERIAVLNSSITSLVNDLVDEALYKLDYYAEEVDAKLDEVQKKADEVDKQLKEAEDRRKEYEKESETARGSRREYLIQQIAKERIAEGKLAAEKKKAAAEEKKLEEQKEEMAKKRLELEAKARISQEANITITNASAAADAVAAAVAAIKSGSTIGFPANLVAIAAGVSAVAMAIASAKKLTGTIREAQGKTRFKDGGYVPAEGGMIHGPSHDEGGIPFTVRGREGFEMEGGEWITSRAAVKNNLDTLKRINTLGRSIRFVAVPEYQVRQKFSTGGQVPGDGIGASVNPATINPDNGITSEDIATLRSVLLKIEANTARAADKELAFPDPWTSRQIVRQAQQLDKDEQTGDLFKVK